MSGFLVVDGKNVKTPAKFEVGIQDVSSADAGRTQDAIMHKNRVAQKITIALAWNATTPEETSEILTAFDPEYVDVSFINPKTNKRETRTFYSGDKAAPMKSWFVGGKWYSQVSFSIIER